MQPSLRIRRFLLHLLIAVGVASCANIGRPSGGEKDTQGPEVIGVVPFPGTLNFTGNEITFYFDEFLKPGSQRNEVFISPVPPIDPEVTIKNKQLRIRFRAPLRDSTTYVITIGTGVADYNESNKMKKSFTYAFSTGDILDSLKFSGEVTDMWTGRGEKDTKVLLFRASDVVENGILDRRPEYVSVADPDGKFDFQFLAPGRYMVFAIKDANNDFKYNGISEKIGLAEDPLVVLDPTDSIPLKLKLVSFFQDTLGPKVKTAKWTNDHTIHVEFAEPIRTHFGPDSLRMEITDTAGGNTHRVEYFRWAKRDHKHLYIHSPIARTEDIDLHFKNFMDSLGHKLDTTVRISMKSQVKEEIGKWFDKPVNLPLGQHFVLPSLVIYPDSVDSSMVQLQDTAGKFLPVAYHPAGMQLYMNPLEVLDHAQPYRLVVRRAFPLPSNKTIDTVIVMKLRFPNPDEYGTISGKVLGDSTRPAARFVSLFRGAAGTGSLIQDKSGEAGSKRGGGRGEAEDPNIYEERFDAPSSFKFVFLHPGKYTMDIIDDTDGNGVLTPGSLNPYTFPEKVYHIGTKLDVRAKWDYEDVEIYPIPGDNKGGDKGKGGEKGEPDSDAPAPKGGK